MRKSNKIIGIFLVSTLLIVLVFIIIFREKQIKNNNDNFKIELDVEQQDTSQENEKSEIDVLYDQYWEDTENKENELKSLLKQSGDLKFIQFENIYTSNQENDSQKYPILDCDNEIVKFEFIPDPYRKQTDENIIFEDRMDIQIINKKTNKIIQQKETYVPWSISKLNFNNADYYITEEYTGGAHCCHEQRIIACKDGKFTIGDTANFGSNGDLGDFFIKNNQIYFTKLCGRFDYFNLSYASSGGMNYVAFYKLDTDSNKFVDVSKEFPDYYSALAKQQNDWVIKLKNYEPNFFSGLDELWYYPLIKRLTASYFSGESQEIYKKQFIEDMNYFIGDSSTEEQSFLLPITKDNVEKIFNDAMRILNSNNIDTTI
ncbi:MAG TPA: hypothetical protein PLD95_00050 [bacterium]|jgi:hypothetical protein|nr:hypothetical protein [bacterium]HOG37848.1 hypothetical protein [bacterium]HQI03065.1 hypothetical protein [bacterium]